MNILLCSVIHRIMLINRAIQLIDMPRAKPKTDDMPKGVKEGKCGCNPAWMIVGWIIGALGIWALVGGFATQFTSAAPTSVNPNILGWYFVGLLLIGLAKMSKWKACGRCCTHKC